MATTFPFPHPPYTDATFNAGINGVLAVTLENLYRNVTFNFGGNNNTTHAVDMTDSIDTSKGGTVTFLSGTDGNSYEISGMACVPDFDGFSPTNSALDFSNSDFSPNGYGFTVKTGLYQFTCSTGVSNLNTLIFQSNSAPIVLAAPACGMVSLSTPTTFTFNGSQAIHWDLSGNSLSGGAGGIDDLLTAFVSLISAITGAGSTLELLDLSGGSNAAPTLDTGGSNPSIQFDIPDADALPPSGDGAWMIPFLGLSDYTIGMWINIDGGNNVPASFTTDGVTASIQVNISGGNSSSDICSAATTAFNSWATGQTAHYNCVNNGNSITIMDTRLEATTGYDCGNGISGSGFAAGAPNNASSLVVALQAAFPSATILTN